MVYGVGNFTSRSVTVTRSDKGIWELIAFTLCVGVNVHRVIFSRHGVVDWFGKRTMSSHLNEKHQLLEPNLRTNGIPVKRSPKVKLVNNIDTQVVSKNNYALQDCYQC